MENDINDKLESIEIRSSILIERTLLRLGVLFYDAVINMERADELELLLGATSEYGAMASAYGERTGRMPESMAVDLNESVLMKLDSIKHNGETEWLVYATQFKDGLCDVSQNLGIDISFE